LFLVSPIIIKTMKKLLFKCVAFLMVFVLIISQTLSLSAKTIDPGLPNIHESIFTLDEGTLDAAMQELNELESYLDQNEGVTYADLATFGSSLIYNISDSSYPMGMKGEYDDILHIPPFLWGCVLGCIGVSLVNHMSDGNKELVKKAIYGAIIPAAAGVILLIYFITDLTKTLPETVDGMESCISYVFNEW
jgi:hypothetical protein